MLKEGLTWFTLASNNLKKQYKTYQIYFQKMACGLELTCNFLFGYCSYTLPEDTIGIDITVHMLRGHIPSGKIEACKYPNAVHRVWKSTVSFPKKENEGLY